MQKTFTDELDADSRRDLPIVIATMPATRRQRKIALGALISPLEVFVHESLERGGLVAVPPLKKIEFGLKSVPRLIANRVENFAARM
jgi:hypothetical protein